ncbi:hypothetical protein ACJX0J_005025 [Zea mays]
MNRDSTKGFVFFWHPCPLSRSRFRRKPNWLLPITISNYSPSGIIRVLLFLCYGMNIPYQFVILTHNAITSLKKERNGQTELLEERIFNSITWAPRIWGPWDNLFDCRDRYAEYDWGFSYGYWSGCHETAIYSNYFWYIYHKKGEVQETDSDFLQSGTMQGFFRNKPIDWDLRTFLFPIQRSGPLSLCFHVENSLQMKMKRWQSGLVPVPGEKSLLNIWLATGSPGEWEWARTLALPYIINGLFILILYPRLTEPNANCFTYRIFVKKEQRMTKDETLLVFTLVFPRFLFSYSDLAFHVLISATRDFRERTKSKLVKIMIWAGIVVITFAIAVRIYPIFIFFFLDLGSFSFTVLDRLIDFLDRYLWACAQGYNRDSQTKRGIVVTFSCRSNRATSFGFLRPTLAVGYRLLSLFWLLLFDLHYSVGHLICIKSISKSKDPKEVHMGS